MNIYVSNLSFDVKGDDLKNYFAAYGEVSSSAVITDKDSGRSKGFGFIEMPIESEAITAIKELDQSILDGRQIKVSEARPRTERSFEQNSFNRNNYSAKRKW